MPALILYEPGKPAVAYYLVESETRVGSARLNHLAVQDDAVTPYHFAVVGDGGRWRLLDKSGRGVVVDGRSVYDVELLDGDVISLGGVRVRGQGEGRQRAGNRLFELKKKLRKLEIAARSGTRASPGPVKGPPGHLKLVS